MKYGMKLKAADVQQNFNKFFDTVTHDHPILITQDHETVVALNFEHLDFLLRFIQFHAIVKKDETGEYGCALTEIEDLVVVGTNADDTIEGLVRELVEYAKEYLTNKFNSYFHMPNQRKHFPYVLKVAMQDSIEDVECMISFTVDAP